MTTQATNTTPRRRLIAELLREGRTYTMLRLDCGHEHFVSRTLLGPRPLPAYVKCNECLKNERRAALLSK